MKITIFNISCWMGIALVAGALARNPAAHDPATAAPIMRKAPYPLVYPAYYGNRINIPADNPLTREGVYLGRMLFYEPALSSTNRLSCSSCHLQQFAFTDGRAFSPGVDGILTSRNAMSLANVLWTRNFFWDGRAASLEDQALTPLTSQHEMGQPLSVSAAKLDRIRDYPPLFQAAFGSDSITGDRIIKAIAQFERTMISAGSRYDAYLRGEYQPTPDETAGIALFMTDPQPEKGIRGGGCAHCHGGPRIAAELFHNNGLDSFPKDHGRENITGLPADRGRFRVPTLRNIALTAPYMHDGRFPTLEQVLEHYSEHILSSPSLSPLMRHSNEAGGRGIMLTGPEKARIISFLHMLTDSTFISDPRYTDPHLKHTTR
jgi:cytochrome c peroxidase